MSYWTEKRILVTGATGFLGQHLVQALGRVKAKEIIGVGSKDYDLTKPSEVSRLLANATPDVVFHLAGLVGGILANRERPADFFYDNLMIGTLMIDQAYRHGVKKLITVGAGCGYPEFATMPLKESDLWSGFPQKESAPYSLAKRMLTIQGSAYFQQHGFVSVTCIPGNIYGEFDNFNLNDSHVIPALVRKFVEAVQADRPAVEVWGSGLTTRDYVYAGDVAAGMVRAAEVYSQPNVVNLSSGEETSVRQICSTLTEITGFKGSINWQSDRPEGQKRRWFDVSKARADLDFKASVSLYEGLKRTVSWYLENFNNDRVRR